MEIIFYLNKRRISKAMLVKLLGAIKVKQFVDEAQDAFMKDPNEFIQFITPYGLLTIDIGV
jgi:hypothetical protein